MSTPNTITETVTPEGGGLLLLPASLLSDWKGTEPPSNGRVLETEFRWAEFDNPDAPSTDYDRVCDVEELIATLEVGAGQGIVLTGPYSTGCFFLPDKAEIILTRTYQPEAEAFLMTLTEEDWREEPFHFTFEEGPLILFDAGTMGSNARESWASHLVFDLLPETYTIATYEKVDESVFWYAHRLLRQEERLGNP